MPRTATADRDARAELIAFRQGTSLLRVTVDRWGPVVTGGFPPGIADKG